MKIVMVVNTDVSVGLVANTAAVLGISLGKYQNDIIGPECKDNSNIRHKGITKESIPILGTDSKNIKRIYKMSSQNDVVNVIDFNQIAQQCKNYSDYITKLSSTCNNDIEFSGICLSGPKKEINRLTGSLPLYK